MQDSDYDFFLAVATEAAQQAGCVIRAAFDQPKTSMAKTSSVDLVTETDKRCEVIIKKRLIEAFPDHK